MLTLFGNPVSSNSQKVQVFLEETQIPYEHKVLDLMKGDQAKQEFLAKNPFGAVPTIAHGDFHLAESNAILRYLAQRFGKHGWYPVSLEDRARVDQAMDFVSLHVARWTNALTWYRVIAPMMKLPHNQAAVDEAHVQLARFLPRLERYLSRQTSYLCGAEPTIADAAFTPIAAQLLQLQVPLRDFPRTEALAARLTARPAWKKVQGEVQKLLQGAR